MVFTRGSYEAKHDDYGATLIYETQRLNEYYPVEKRSRIGLEAFLPSSGPAVYHCDIKGSNEWQDRLDSDFHAADISAPGEKITFRVI